jgi:Glycosyltransferase
MNLYIFNESSQAAVYGIGTYIHELTTAIQNNSINICLINLNQDIPNIKTEVIDSIRYWSIPVSKFEQRTIDYKKQDELYFRNVVYLLQLHIKDKTDLVFHLNVQRGSKFVEELKNAFDCKVVITIHYFNWCFKLSGNITHYRKLLRSNETDQNNELKKKIEESYHDDKNLFEIADYIHCLSKNTFQILCYDYKIDPVKLKIIPNGLVDLDQSSDEQLIRKKYNIPNIPVILFAGRLEKAKGLIYALKAFRSILNTQPCSCHFIIVGGGSLTDHLKECEDIWTNVTWTGMIDRRKLYDLYSITDIGIIPSFHEQCSYVAIEMMMHGLPIIGSTSTSSGMNEMIKDGKTGLHVPLIEYDDRIEIDTGLLAEKMLYLVQNPHERKRLGKNARKRYEEIYSMDIFRKNILDFYQGFVHGKNESLT